MEYQGFKIKISDLINNPGNQDIINFKNLYTKNIDNLSKNGINGQIHLQSINSDTIVVVFKNLSGTLEYICDYCGESFSKDFSIKNYETKFVTKKIHHDLSEKIHDDEYIINEKDGLINIENALIQSILIKSNIVNICENCKNIDEEDFEEEIIEEPKNEIKWNFK